MIGKDKLGNLWTGGNLCGSFSKCRISLPFVLCLLPLLISLYLYLRSTFYQFIFSRLGGTQKYISFGILFAYSMQQIHTQNAQQKKCAALRNLVNAFNISDVFRHFYPNKKEFTFHRADSASRIDRFYAPQFMVSHLTSAEHLPQPFSDHCLVEIILNVPNIQKIEIPRPYRYSYWKMNASNMDEDFMASFKIVYLNPKNL